MVRLRGCAGARRALFAVGGSVAPVVTMESCPQGKREISVEWVADDPAIAAVQAGVITGVSPGETTVRTRDDHEAPHVAVHVTVIEEA